MREIKVLITGGGAPGIMGTLYSLKNNFDNRRVKTVCVDMDSGVVGRYLCDSFYQVPPASSSDFIPAVQDVCRRENVDVVLPQVTAELLKFARAKKYFEESGAAVATSSPDAIITANNKFNLIRVSEKLNVPYPKYRLVRTWDELTDTGEDFGYPFAIKPPESNGMRGFRVVHKSYNARERFFRDKPDSAHVDLETLHRILGDEFPELLVTEYLPGVEYTVDVLSSKEVHVVVPRLRRKIRSGITFVGETEKREDIIDYVTKLTEKIGLEYAHGFQFKLDGDGTPKILESNPRVQGTMVLSSIARANVIYGAVKIALGEELPEFRPVWGARLVRYWGAVGIAGDEVCIV